MRALSRRKTLGLFAMVAVLTVTTSSTVAVFASHQFGDVPQASWVHPAISHIADAGCATGYPDGNFQPDENPSRAQFAFWVSNCGGRAGSSAAVGDFVTDGDADPAFVTLEFHTGGAPVPGAEGYIVVLAEVDVETSDSQQSTWTLERENPDNPGNFIAIDDARLTVVNPGIAVDPLQPSDSVTLMAMVRSDAAAVENFRLGYVRENGAPNSIMEAQLVAMYFPFDNEGPPQPSS
ncbi:MAG: S-layer homology domain-containing protein [Actinomycetota bacterium]